MTTNTYILGSTPNTVRAAHGSVLTAPDGWAAATEKCKETVARVIEQGVVTSEP